ncbi:unnamed protein product [Gordionus sp. m RMFG-2023]
MFESTSVSSEKHPITYAPFLDNQPGYEYNKNSNPSPSFNSLNKSQSTSLADDDALHSSDINNLLNGQEMNMHDTNGYNYPIDHSDAKTEQNNQPYIEVIRKDSLGSFSLEHHNNPKIDSIKLEGVIDNREESIIISKEHKLPETSTDDIKDEQNNNDNENESVLVIMDENETMSQSSKDSKNKIILESDLVNSTEQTVTSMVDISTKVLDSSSPINNIKNSFSINNDHSFYTIDGCNMVINNNENNLKQPSPGITSSENKTKSKSAYHATKSKRQYKGKTDKGRSLYSSALAEEERRLTDILLAKLKLKNLANAPHSEKGNMSKDCSKYPLSIHNEILSNQLKTKGPFIRLSRYQDKNRYYLDDNSINENLRKSDGVTSISKRLRLNANPSEQYLATLLNSTPDVQYSPDNNNVSDVLQTRLGSSSVNDNNENKPSLFTPSTPKRFVSLLKLSRTLENSLSTPHSREIHNKLRIKPNNARDSKAIGLSLPKTDWVCSFCGKSTFLDLDLGELYGPITICTLTSQLPPALIQFRFLPLELNNSNTRNLSPLSLPPSINSPTKTKKHSTPNVKNRENSLIKAKKEQPEVLETCRQTGIQTKNFHKLSHGHKTFLRFYFHTPCIMWSSLVHINSFGFINLDVAVNQAHLTV